MRYISTRGETRPVSFDKAVVKGQALDGGLYIPVALPEQALFSRATPSSVADLAEHVLPEWMGRPFPEGLADDAFSIDIPVVDLGARAKEYSGIHVVELFHGPTGSFKDFGARFLARWLSAVSPPVKKERVVLVATSGDTGSAVAEGFAGSDRTAVFVLYPVDGVSPYQRRQLTMRRTGVFPLGVRGSFDDCQIAVKQAFRDPSMSHLDLTSANSINIGRLLPQMLFYLWSAVQTGCEDPVFVVPSGNLGNLCAGLMAGQSSMPGARFVAATNKNRFLVDYLADQDSEPGFVRPSLSNAMDVAVPSNLERMVHLFGRQLLLSLVTGRSVSDGETRSTMKTIWERADYVVDPHTAVGLRAALDARVPGERQTLVMATAHPDKYRELVSEVIGRADRPTGDDVAVEEQIIDSGLPALKRVILEVTERRMN